MQLFSVQPEAPPPALPVSVQFVSVLDLAPTPELPLRVQLLRVLKLAPYEALPLNVQSFTVPPEAPPAPLVSVKPDRLASPAKDTHRFDRAPLIIVNNGPLTLRTLRGPDAATQS